MKSKPTVALVLDKSVKGTKKPLKIRITYGRVPHLYSIDSDKTLTQEEFDNDKRKVTKEAKEEASRALSIAKNVIDALGQDFSFDVFRKMYKEQLYGKKRDTTSFLYVCENYLATQTLKDKTISSYLTPIRWIEKFKPATKTTDINQDYIRDLLSYIKQNHRESVGKDISENTIRIYLRTYRAIYNYAINKEFVANKNPFSSIKGQSLSSVKREKGALSEDELKTLIDYEPANEKERLGKDFFILTLQLCGANIGDILSFKNHNIKGDTVVFVRRKTQRSGIETILDLPDVAISILNKYGCINQEKPDDYILPYLANVSSNKAINSKIHDVIRQINKGLKSICKATGMEKFTTYNARHTYASRAQSSGMTAEQIQKFLGHTSSRTTQVYLNSLTTEIRTKNKGVLDDLLK